MSPIDKHPDGTLIATGIGVHVYAYGALLHAVEFKVTHNGMSLTNKMPTVKAIKKRWELPDNTRTYEQLLPILTERWLKFLNAPEYLTEEQRYKILLGKEPTDG